MPKARTTPVKTGRPPRHPADHPLASEHMRAAHMLDPRVSPAWFEPIVFQAFISATDMKVTSAGSLRVGIEVLNRHVDDAFPLRHLAAQAYPLRVTVEPWPDFIRRVEADEAEIEQVRGRLAGG